MVVIKIKDMSGRIFFKELFVSFKYGRLLFLSLLGLLCVGLDVIGYNLYKLVFFRNNK